MNTMYNKYYYPISSVSLAHIFGSACIYPAALYQNRNEDVQSRLNEVILLTSNFGCKESDCCLEVFITDVEKEFVIDLRNGFFIYEKPIPISRVKKIYFRNESQIDRTITSIRLSTAFIPDSIVDHNDNEFSLASPSQASLPVDFETNIPKLQKQQEDFDRILGALALMKVAHDDECNVSPHYIDVLSFFNKKIREIKSSFGNIDDSLCFVFRNPYDTIRNVVTEQTIKEEARKTKQQIIKKETTKIIDFSNLEGFAYLFSILYSYGVENESKRKRIDELILGNFQQLKEGKEEKVAFYYGYNRGYSILGNVYQNDRKKIEVKYTMESLLDYYTIESVYKHVVFQKVSESFDYFDWVTPQRNKKVRKGEYIVIDTLIRDKKKIHLFSKEWWREYVPIYLKKEDITIFGMDLSSAVIEKFIKPWTEFVKVEVNEQFEEIKEQMTESFTKESNLLKDFLSEAHLQIKMLNEEIKEKDIHIKHIKEQIEDLKNTTTSTSSARSAENEEKDIVETTQPNEEISNANTEIEKEMDSASVAGSKDDNSIVDLATSYDNAIIDDAQVQGSFTQEMILQDKREITYAAIDYALMNIKALKSLAKDKGIHIGKNPDKREVILKLLGLDSESQATLF